MTIDELVAIERESIERFVRGKAPWFDGKRVLDYGCGNMPYRRIIEEAGGEYVPWNRASYPGCKGSADVGPDDPLRGHRYDLIVCTQVVQYVPLEELANMFSWFATCAPTLLITWPTTWPEVDAADLLRLTKWGMWSLLDVAGYRVIIEVERRAVFDMGGFELAYGYGMLVGR